MDRDQIVELLFEQQEILEKRLEDKSDPDYKYYLGQSAMVDFILMRIENG